MNPLGSVIDIIAAVLPLDLQTARSGDYISLKNAAGALVVFFKGAGTAGDDPTLELQQATTAAGGSVKDLNGFVDIYKKQAATDLTGTGSWTKVTQTADEDFVGDGTSAEEAGLYAAWVPADLLDVDNGFDFLACNVKDVGNNAQLGCVLYILHGLRHQATPADVPSSIA